MSEWQKQKGLELDFNIKGLKIADAWKLKPSYKGWKSDIYNAMCLSKSILI